MSDPQKPVTVSASQISTWKACQRKWGWNYIAGVKTDPHPSAALGSAVHKELENYLQGKPIDFSTKAGEIAAAAIENLPPPKSGTTELAFSFSKNGITYRGYKDFVRPGEVWDHKTTSDLKWAKSPEDLAKDPQAVLYAVDAFIDDPKNLWVDLFWGYVQTRGSHKTKLVHLRMYPEAASEAFKEIEASAEEIRTASVDTDDPKGYVLSLKPTPSECSAIGGCPYQGLCNLSPEERRPSTLFTKEPGDTMATTAEILEKLKARQTANPVGVNPPEAAIPVPEPTTPEVVHAVQKFVDKRAAESTPAPLLQITEPKKRGRPTKAAEPVAAQDGPTVYLDCMPLGGEHTMFDDLVREAAKRIHAEHGAADYRFIQFHSGAILLGTVQTILDEQKPTSIVVRDSGTPEAMICSSALVNRAGMVVVGT